MPHSPAADSSRVTSVSDLVDSGAAIREMGIHRAAARVLAACAGAQELCPTLAFRDEIAESAFGRLGGSLSQFDAAELRCTAFRSHVIDGLAREFFARTPGGLGVGLWSLLGTRAHRLQEFPWVDVDSPAMAELRRFVLPARAGWLQLGTCLCHQPWLTEISPDRSRPLLMVLDEGVLPVAPFALMRLLDDVSSKLAIGSELVLAFDAHAPLRPASPLRRGSALELVLREPDGGEQLARYPRLRFVDGDAYESDVGASLLGVNAVATLYSGMGAPALAHLRVA
jgi:O-methyltransferase involved in polyketide biosynthesis